jgi:nucleotide-binding universal stress UspA family protein
MYKMILAPLDGSQRAEAILPHVAHIGRSQGAKIVLLSVTEQPVMLERDEVADFSAFHESYEKKRNAAKTYLEEKKKELAGKGYAVEIRLTNGPVVGAILRVAEEVGADLIAMTSHGLGGSPRTFYGSVAAGVLQRLDRPLLIIRTPLNGEA